MWWSLCPATRPAAKRGHAERAAERSEAALIYEEPDSAVLRSDQLSPDMRSDNVTNQRPTHGSMRRPSQPPCCGPALVDRPLLHAVASARHAAGTVSSEQRRFLAARPFSKFVSDEHFEESVSEDAIPTNLVAAQDIDVDQVVQPGGCGGP
jgi:hypothetical protein